MSDAQNTEGVEGSRTIRVALVDDQRMFRSGIRMIVDSQPDMQVVAEAGDGAEAVASAAVLGADIVLMDVRMPQLDGIAATRAIVARGDSRPRVIVLTTFDLDDATLRAIQAGASGFLLKDAEPEFLLAAIRAVDNGSQVISASATRELFERAAVSVKVPPHGWSELTPRESEVFKLAAKGLSNAEIAAAEFLSEATVKTHISRILAKLGLRDRVQLVVFGYEHGLVG